MPNLIHQLHLLQRFVQRLDAAAGVLLEDVTGGLYQAYGTNGNGEGRRLRNQVAMVVTRSVTRAKGRMMDLLPATQSSSLPALLQNGAVVSPQTEEVMQRLNEQFAHRQAEVERLGQLERVVNQVLSDNYLFSQLRAVSDIDMMNKLIAATPSLTEDQKDLLAGHLVNYLRNVQDAYNIAAAQILQRLVVEQPKKKRGFFR